MKCVRMMPDGFSRRNPWPCIRLIPTPAEEVMPYTKPTVTERCNTKHISRSSQHQFTRDDKNRAGDRMNDCDCMRRTDWTPDRWVSPLLPPPPPPPLHVPSFLAPADSSSTGECARKFNSISCHRRVTDRRTCGRSKCDAASPSFEEPEMPVIYRVVSCWRLRTPFRIKRLVRSPDGSTDRRPV